MSERLSTVKTTLKPHFQVSPRFYTAAVEQLGIIRVIVLRLPDTEIWEWPGDKALHCHAGLQERIFFYKINGTPMKPLFHACWSFMRYKGVRSFSRLFLDTHHISDSYIHHVHVAGKGST